MNTICPFCGLHHDAVSGVGADAVFPGDGDVTLCIECGEVCVFDGDADGGLRKPTKLERRDFRGNPTLTKLIDAWKCVKRQQ